MVCACYFWPPKQWGAKIYYRHSNSQFPPHKIISPAMALLRGGGGEKKGKRKRGGEKRRRGEKEKKLIVYRYMCLRVYLYAI